MMPLVKKETAEYVFYTIYGGEQTVHKRYSLS
jgi:hypothetical protein